MKDIRRDRRRKEFNQAIFHIRSDEEVAEMTEFRSHIGMNIPVSKTYPVWVNMDMDMVLKCFDNAVKDWRKSFCDVDNCRRKP